MLADAADPLLFNGKVAAACVLGIATAAASAVPWILPRIFTRHSVDAINVGIGRRPLAASSVVRQLTEVASHDVTRISCFYQVLVAAAAGVFLGRSCVTSRWTHSRHFATTSRRSLPVTQTADWSTIHLRACGLELFLFCWSVSISSSWTAASMGTPALMALSLTITWQRVYGIWRPTTFPCL